MGLLSIVQGLHCCAGGIPGRKVAALIRQEHGACGQAAGHTHLGGAAFDDVPGLVCQPVKCFSVDPGSLTVRQRILLLRDPLHDEGLQIDIIVSYKGWLVYYLHPLK